MDKRSEAIHPHHHHHHHHHHSLSTILLLNSQRQQKDEWRAMLDSLAWTLQYTKLLEFKRKTGHCRVTQRCKEDYSLGRWVSQQRYLHTKNAILKDRMDLLNKIGFAWKMNCQLSKVSIYDDKWFQQYEKLVVFQRQHKHCRVPTKYKEEPALGRWVDTQRKANTNQKMLPHREKLLNEIGFVWKIHLTYRRKDDTIVAHVSSEDTEWHLQYEKLVALKEEYANHRVPSKKHKDDFLLRSWVSIQRATYTNDKMRLDRKDLLDKVGFAWNARILAAGLSATTKDVSGLVIGLCHASARTSFSLILFFLCLICVVLWFATVHQQCGSPKRSNERSRTSTKPS